MSVIIKLNEYIEVMNEITPLLDQTLENINIEEIILENDGCSQKLINKIVDYIEKHDCNVTVR